VVRCEGRRHVPLRTMYALVTAVLYVVSVGVGGRAKLNLIFKRVCEKAKRFYGVAAFFQYAVAASTGCRPARPSAPFRPPRRPTTPNSPSPHPPP